MNKVVGPQSLSMHLRLIDPKSARECTFSAARPCLSPAKCLSAVLTMQLSRIDNCCISAVSQVSHLASRLQEATVREETMSIIDAVPGESNASIISSIINLVCPQCGGSMLEFQCYGRCHRNWLAEWEWANLATRGAAFNKPTRPERRTR